jgi:hypothetical protein
VPVQRTLFVTLGAFAGLSVCAQADPRTTVSHKGSLLMYPAIEIEWNAAGQVVVDTVLSITNDYSGDVRVQFYFINGDPPVDEIVIPGPPPTTVREAEPGWGFIDCEFALTPDQSVDWSAAIGGARGCQPFSVLDPQGRPDPDGDTSRRVLRGYAMAWAVDADGREINWNHLSGGAVTVDYELTAAWEHGVFAFAAQSGAHGQVTDDRPGLLILNGSEYDAPYDALLMEFDASGAMYTAPGGFAVSADTDLTLFVVEADLRETHFDLITTMARYDVWNMDERRFSGTQHLVTCWHQRLLSDLGLPNNFIRSALQTDKGKARINGLPSLNCRPRILPAALLGAVRTKLAFSGAATGQDSTSETLIGQGCKDAAVIYDVRDAVPEPVRGRRIKPRGVDRVGGDRVSRVGDPAWDVQGD